MQVMLLLLIHYPQVVVSYSKESKYHQLTRSLKNLGRYIGRGNRKSIANVAVSNISLRPEIVQKLGQVIWNKEMVRICSDDSILRLTWAF